MSFNQGASAIVFYYIGYCLKSISITRRFVFVCFAIVLINLPFGGMSISSCFYTCYPLNIMGASATTLLVYLLCKKMPEVKYLSPFLSWCGRNSLLILCVHLVYLKTIYLYPQFSNIFIHFMFSLFFAILGSWLLSKIPFIKYIFQIK